MKYIAIVECISSGILYVDEIISQGYRPLVINARLSHPYLLEYRKLLRRQLEDKVDFIDETEDFDGFVNKLRSYDIAAVFPGSEGGVILADRLTKALGLRGNDPDTTYLRCTKKGMFEALGKAGIRRIETALVQKEEDIKDFWKKHDLKKCVLKFSKSGSTMGLKICSSIEDATEHYKSMQTMMNYSGEIGSDILIQECIDGTEYIVDTLSCNGEHMLTDVWVYKKIRADDGTLAYDYAKLVKDLEPGHVDMIRYAYKVLDAVEMRWGICHSEIMIDDKGPILIETNARPIGLAMTPSYLDEILGYHLTDLAIDSYFHPEKFRKLKHKPYNPPKYALMKLMIVPEDIEGDLKPTMVISNLVRSTREILFFGKAGVTEYKRTIDLDSSPVAIKMANSDYGALMRDYEMLRLIESNYFHLFYTLDDKIDATEQKTDLQALVKTLDPRWRFSVVKDDGMFVAEYNEIKKSDGWSIFDGAIYACCGKSTSGDRLRSIYRTIQSVRSGGVVMIVPESYESIKSGSVMMELVMNIAGVHVLAPSCDSIGIIYGLKK